MACGNITKKLGHMSKISIFQQHNVPYLSQEIWVLIKPHILYRIDEACWFPSMKLAFALESFWHTQLMSGSLICHLVGKSA